jgi:hypothetical protein
MLKVILGIIGSLALLAIAAGAGFEEGKAFQSNQAAQIRNQFFQSRGLNPTAGSPNTGNLGAGFGGGVTGQIKDVQGNTIDLSSGSNVTVVELTANTRIEKSTQGSAADLKSGEQLIVRGQRDASGKVTAAQIQIVSNGALQSTPTAP